MPDTSQSYYIRVAAVNLDYSVYDTHNISVIRGGSFTLLDAVNMLKQLPELENVGSGASEGIFKCHAADAEALHQIKQKILSELKTRCENFATFVISTVPVKDDVPFPQAVEQLKAQSFWQQYRQPSMIFPTDDGSDAACFLDRVRPAAGSIKIGEQDQYVSAAVKDRHTQGKDLRDNLYNILLNESGDNFTHDLETLATGSGDGALDGKIAFIHLDGNRFGSIRDQLCQTGQKLGAFQHLIQETLQKPALEKILKAANAPANPSFKTSSGKIRLETLMWGGDEIEWVVPASQAWRVLAVFFEHLAGKRFETVNLTYSGGVVFCHHNLPILQVRKYANQLCELAKSSLGRDINTLDNSANRFAFLNMTAFDLISRDVQQFLNDYHAPAQPLDFVVSHPEMETLSNSIAVIKRYFPKTKLHEIIDALHSGKDVSDIRKRAFALISPAHRTEAENALAQLLSLKPHGWFLIADLWPYIGEKS